MWCACQEHIYYFCQRGYVLLSICCFFVCLSATSLINYWSCLHENFTRHVSVIPLTKNWLHFGTHPLVDLDFFLQFGLHFWKLNRSLRKFCVIDVVSLYKKFPLNFVSHLAPDCRSVPDSPWWCSALSEFLFQMPLLMHERMKFDCQLLSLNCSGHLSNKQVGFLVQLQGNSGSANQDD